MANRFELNRAIFEVDPLAKKADCDENKRVEKLKYMHRNRPTLSPKNRREGWGPQLNRDVQFQRKGWTSRCCATFSK